MRVGDQDVGSQVLAVLGGQGDGVEVTSTAEARFLLLAGQPLREPIVQMGPFVMNTRQEIEQAFIDYRNGVLTR